MEMQPTGLMMAGRRLPRSLVLTMSSLVIADPEKRTIARITIKATRPALNDLRFRGEADVRPEGDRAAVCLGNYQLTHVDCTPLDFATLTRTFNDIRTGQARRNQARRK